MTLPLEAFALLRLAVGRRLVEVERLTSTARGRFGCNFLTRVSGPVQMTFSPELVHTLVPLPSLLSIGVIGTGLADDPYADRYQLSRDAGAPTWLSTLIGCRVSDVEVLIYRDAVPSAEPRQAAVQYNFESGGALLYGVYVHGRMDGDELFTPAQLVPSAVSRTLSVLAPEGWR